MAPTTATATDALLRDYYARRYPVEALAWLVSRRGDALVQREWALDGAYYRRYVTADDAAALRGVLRNAVALKAVHIGPVYSGVVQKPDPDADTRLLFDRSRPARKELLFDIDLSDYDFLDLAGGPADPKALNLEACDAAWPVAGIALLLLQRVLHAQFGFGEFLCFYSGRRGAHLWVLDERAMALDEAGRAAIAEFLDLGLTKCRPTRATSSHRVHVKNLGLMPTVYSLFEAVLVGQMGALDLQAHRSTFVDRLALRHESMHNLEEEASRKASGAAAWAYIRTKVTKQAVRLPKECGWFVARLEEVVLAYVWPRLDFQVTKGLNHLIKAPFVAHPKTLRVAVPLRRGELLTFDPSTAPTLGDPGVHAALDARGGHAEGNGLGDWVWYERAAVDTATPMDVDVEDLVPASGAPPPPKTPPRAPRRAPVATAPADDGDVDATIAEALEQARRSDAHRRHVTWAGMPLVAKAPVLTAQEEAERRARAWERAHGRCSAPLA